MKRVLVLLVALGCGGSPATEEKEPEKVPAPVCGNNKIEMNEQCDPPNPVGGCGPKCRFVATVRTRLNVKVRVNGGLEAEYSGFDGDSCSEVVTSGRMGYVALEITGPESISKEITCEASTSHVMEFQKSGDYTVKATIVEDDGQGGRVPLAKAVTRTAKVVENELTDVLLPIPYDTFSGAAKTGILYFRVEKLGTATSCETAMPKATKLRLKLARDGKVVMAETFEEVVRGMTYPPQATDGQALGSCRAGGPMDESVKVRALEWGPYNLTIDVTDDAGATSYCKGFPIFVGAGSDNLIYRFDLPSANACP